MGDLFSIIISAGIVAYVIYKNKERLKGLRIVQIAGVCVSFILTVGIATFLIYFIGNWVVGLITIEWMSRLTSYLIVIVVIFGTLILLYKVVGKITNGVFDHESFKR